jgi:hypothetical protein
MSLLHETTVLSRWMPVLFGTIACLVFPAQAKAQSPCGERDGDVRLVFSADPSSGQKLGDLDCYLPMLTLEEKELCVYVPARQGRPAEFSFDIVNRCQGRAPGMRVEVLVELVLSGGDIFYVYKPSASGPHEPCGDGRSEYVVVRQALGNTPLKIRCRAAAYPEGTRSLVDNYELRVVGVREMYGDQVAYYKGFEPALVLDPRIVIEGAGDPADCQPHPHNPDKCVKPRK